jgi:hypothetical protein
MIYAPGQNHSANGRRSRRGGRPSEAKAALADGVHVGALGDLGADEHRRGGRIEVLGRA